MAKLKKSKGAVDDFRPSKAVRQLREALGLDEDDWKSFLFHARTGLAEYERALWMEEDEPFRLHDVPAQWLEDPVAIGYVFLRVFTHGKKTLATPVARLLLQMLDPEPDGEVPTGTGLAWLHLTKEGESPPIKPDRLVFMALDQSEEFFHGVVEDDVLGLCRLILESQGTIEAWDLHAILTAVRRARIHVRAPFHLFDSLMAADWITRDLKRELCRGMLGCAPEVQRLGERHEAIRASFLANPDQMPEIPRAWLEVGKRRIGWQLPMLRRHAVYALVESAGEPLDVVLKEFHLKSYRVQSSTEAVSLGALDLIGLHAEELGPDVVRRLLAKAIKHGYAPVRQAAYRVGADRFGLDFARPALKDEAGRVRNWAVNVLETKVVRPARKAAHKRRTRSTGQQPGNTSTTP